MLLKARFQRIFIVHTQASRTGDIRRQTQIFSHRSKSGSLPDVDHLECVVQYLWLSLGYWTELYTIRKL